MSDQEDSPVTVNGAANGDDPRKVRIPRTRRVVNPDARMPLMEHIRELRNRVFKALLVVTVGSIAGWFIEEPVFKFITGPYCKLPARIRNGYQPGLPGGSQPQDCHLIVTGLFDYFFIHLELAIVIGIVISAPFWMYQLWAFVAPGCTRGSGAGLTCSSGQSSAVRAWRHVRLLRHDQGAALPA